MSEIEVTCPVCSHRFYEWPQPKQEPVAYGMWDTQLGRTARLMMVRLDKGQDGCTVPLFTYPPDDDTALLRQCLEALENSIDLVQHEYRENWRHGVPTREKQLNGLKEQMDTHEATIDALKERLNEQRKV